MRTPRKKCQLIAVSCIRFVFASRKVIAVAMLVHPAGSPHLLAVLLKLENKNKKVMHSAVVYTIASSATWTPKLACADVTKHVRHFVLSSL